MESTVEVNVCGLPLISVTSVCNEVAVEYEVRDGRSELLPSSLELDSPEPPAPRVGLDELDVGLEFEPLLSDELDVGLELEVLLSGELEVELELDVGLELEVELELEVGLELSGT